MYIDKLICLKSSALKIIFLFVFCLVQAQDIEAFNRIYNKVYVETSQTDITKALETADSLYQASKTPLFKVKSLMLSASLYQISAEPKKAILKGLEAEKIIVKTNEYAWQTRVYGFLATQHRIVAMYSQSNAYIQKAIKAADKLEGEQAATTLGFLLQERAFGEDARNENEKALHSFKEARNYFKQIKTDSDYLIAQNNVFIGQCYIKLENIDSAKVYYQKVLDKEEILPKNHIIGLAYLGNSKAYLMENDLENATKYLEKANEIAKISPYLEFVKVLYDTQVDLYSRTSDIERLNLAYLKRDSIKAILVSKKDEYIDESYSSIISENRKLSKQKTYGRYYILMSALLFLGSISYFVRYRVKQKKDVLALKQIIEKLKKSKIEQSNHKEEEENLAIDEKIVEKIPVAQVKVEEENKSENDSESIMLQETEEKILKSLKKFEDSNLFTKKTISLSALASYCNTNVKYLSYAINKHKEKDFNNYINELRVNYIIAKLYEEPVYRKYKLATLAEEAGFSSHNKFSSVFKKHTSISPSNFIKYLEVEMKSKPQREMEKEEST